MYVCLYVCVWEQKRVFSPLGLELKVVGFGQPGMVPGTELWSSEGAAIMHISGAISPAPPYALKNLY